MILKRPTSASKKTEAERRSISAKEFSLGTPQKNYSITSRRRRYVLRVILNALLILALISCSSMLVNDSIISRDNDNAAKVKDGSISITGSRTKPALSTNQHLKRKKRQQICIFAGPHKTGTSSIQANLYRWSRETVKFADSKYRPLLKPIISWVWPVPEEIAKVEHSDPKAWAWSPSKVFYPMIESMGPHKKERTLFQRYADNEILDMYRKTIKHYWEEGHNITIGTEAMDMIVKLEKGPDMIRRISVDVLPGSINGDQITAVVVYRTPKIKHLISMWHQNCNKPRPDNKFYEWITTTDNSLGALDALGMVEMFLHHSNWNVVLIDLEGMTKNNYDISNFVACEVLGEECEGKKLRGLHKDETIIANVRSNKRPPNVPNTTLDEMDVVLQNYDCKYTEILSGKKNDRLKIFYPEGLKKTMNACERLDEVVRPLSRGEMRRQLSKIALKYGSLW